MRGILITIYLLITCTVVCGGGYVLSRKSNESERRIVIRFDDYGIWCSADWIAIEEKLLELHKEFKVPITWSVVPNSIYPTTYHQKSLKIYPDDNGVKFTNPYPLHIGTRRVDVLMQSIRDSISYIAAHGYYHPKYYSNITNSEFFAVDYDTQFRKIRCGKMLLDSLFNTNVHIFVPPHNTYDCLTLDALTESGYSIISARDPGSHSPEDNSQDISFLNFTTDNFERLASKYKNELTKYSGDIVDVLLLHHTSFTDNEGKISDAKLLNYATFLNELNQQGVKAMTFDEVCADSKLLTANNSTRKMIYHVFSKISPRIAVKVLNTGMTESQIVWTFLFFLFLLGGLIGYPFAYFLRIPVKHERLAYYSIGVVSFIVLVIGLKYIFALNAIKYVPVSFAAMSNVFLYVVIFSAGFYFSAVSCMVFKSIKNIWRNH